MNDLISHAISTISYRFNKSVTNSPSGFGKFAAGNGVRTPEEIIAHMHHVLLFAKEIILDQKIRKQQPTLLPLPVAKTQFYNELEVLTELVSKTQIEIEIKKRLIQGPLSDILTHVGQLAMLSRLYNNPIPYENYSIANI